MINLKINCKFKYLSTAGIFTALILMLLASALSGVDVAADEERSITDLREDLSNIKLSSAESYTEVKDMQSKTILYLYSIERENVSANVKKFVFSVSDFLMNFDEYYKRSQVNSSPGIHRQIVRNINNMYAEADDLQALYNQEIVLQDADEPQDIIYDSRQSISRFLSDEGDFFKTIADNESITPIKLEYLESSRLSYFYAQNYNIAGEIKKEIDSKENEFMEDLSEAEIKINTADSLISEADFIKTTGNPYDIFLAALNYRESIKYYEDAMQLYRYHGFDNPECPFEYSSLYYSAYDKSVRYLEISDELMLEAVKYIVVIGAILMLLILIVMKSVMKWKKDMVDSKSGEDLMFGYK